MPVLSTSTPFTAPTIAPLVSTPSSLVNASSTQTQLPVERRIRQGVDFVDFHERGHTHVQPRRSALPTVTSARAHTAARHNENDRMATMVKKRLKDDTLVQLSQLVGQRGGRAGDERRDAASEPDQLRDDGEEESTQPVEGGSVESWHRVEGHGGGSSSSDGEGGFGDLFVLWNAPVHSWTGTASEAINLLVPLAPHIRGLGLVGGYDDQYVAEYAGRAGDAETLAAMRARGQAHDTQRRKAALSVYVTQYDPGTYAADLQRYGGDRFDYRVGRAMFETTSLPAGWLESMRAMDEIWVPSHFGREVFLKAGVPRSKLVVIPESVDCALFDLQRYSRSVCRRAHGMDSESPAFAFLSVGKWEERKGFEQLVSAFVAEFGFADEDSHVRLYLRTGTPQKDAAIRHTLAQLVHKGLGDGHAAAVEAMLRRIVLLDRVAHKDYPCMFAAADAFVLATHGEGWGRPLLEAQAMGLPVIAPAWSGQTEFLTEQNSLPLPVAHLAPAYEHEPQLLTSAGHTLTQPQRAAHQVAEPVVARRLGVRAAAEVRRRWCREPVARIVSLRLSQIRDKLLEGDE